MLISHGPYDIAGCSRLVRVFLPTRDRTERPPVLVMFDGQNVFDDASAYAGGWHLDTLVKKMAARQRSAPAIIAVHHGGARRIDELGPFNTARGGGRLDELLNWVGDTLLGDMARAHNLAEGPEHTAIGGSSMGGLAALYAHFKRPDRFGGALSMSPSLWFGAPGIFDFVQNASKPWTSRVYLDAGEQEGRMMDLAQRMADVLKQKGYDDRSLRFRRDKRGRHQELSWRRRSPAAIKFLFRATDGQQGPLRV